MRAFGPIVLGALLGVTACKQDANLGSVPDAGDDEADSATAQASMQSACERLAAARCSREAACVAPSLLDAGYDCKAAAIRTCLAYRSPSSNVQAEDVDACTARVKVQSCYELLADGADCVLPPGKLPTGAACSGAAACASAFCSQAGEECGICTDPPLDGQPCSASSCGPGRACALETCSGCTGGTCNPAGNVGSPCNATHACLSSLVCFRSVCTPRSTKEGDACGPDKVGCDPLQALRCDETNVCRTFTPATAGQGCLGGEHPRCTSSNSCVMGHCAPNGEVGAACDSQQGTGCAVGLACSEGSCGVAEAPSCH